LRGSEVIWPEAAPAISAAAYLPRRELGVHEPLRRRVSVAKLTTAKKNKEPKSEFGLPEQRKYPMPDASHARNAKARASQMEHQGKLSAADKKKIDAKADRILKK